MIPLRVACIGKHGQTAQALAAVAAGYPLAPFAVALERSVAGMLKRPGS